MVLILGAFLIQIPLATADVEKYEKVLGSGFDTTLFSYWGNTVSSGFGTAMSVNAPVHPGVGGQVSKVAFAVELDEPFEAVVPIPGYGPVVCDCYPTVENMWVKVEGDSYYWPSPNQIVDNTGTGGNCSFDWAMLFVDVLMNVLTDILFELHQSPPEREWEKDAHWVKAIVREKAMDDPPLQSAAANFYSLFDKKGYNTLTITAGSTISIRCFGFWNGIPVATMVDIGEYSLDFPVEVPVTNEPDTPSTPSGDTSGYKGISYPYSTSTTDPNYDDV